MPPPWLMGYPLLTFTSDDVRRLLEAAIIDTVTAPPDIAPKIAAALAPVLTPGLQDLTDDGPRMTAAEALFVRDTVAAELDAVGGAQTAERLIIANYIDVEPILAAHRRKPESTPAVIGQLTGPLPVPISVPRTDAGPTMPPAA